MADSRWFKLGCHGAEWEEDSSVASVPTEDDDLPSMSNDHIDTIGEDDGSVAEILAGRDVLSDPEGSTGAEIIQEVGVSHNRRAVSMNNQIRVAPGGGCESTMGDLGKKNTFLRYSRRRLCHSRETMGEKHAKILGKLNIFAIPI